MTFNHLRTFVGEFANDFTYSGHKANLFLQVLDAFNAAEKRLKPNPELLFTDVYDEMPKRLKHQLNEMKEHVRKYEEHYPLKMFEEMQK